MWKLDKVAIVTGVSSGIGWAAAEALAGRGYRVFGSVRRADVKVPDGIERLVLDVRSDEDVRRAVAEVVARAGRIDLLVNNAGVALLGAIEETGLDQARALFETNVFGAYRMTQAVLPTMRRRRSGRIVFVSSVVGFLPAPFMGVYAASKHAIEALAEALDHEVRTLGIRATLVEPSFMRTRIDQNMERPSNALDDYSGGRDRFAATVRAAIEGGDDPVVVARAIVKAATVAQPGLRYPVGKKAATLAVLRSLMPAGLFDGAMRREFHLDG